MMKRTKLLLAALLAAVLLAGCGSSSSEAASSSSQASSSPAAPSAAASSSSEAVSAQENGTGALDAAFDALLAANPISNPFEIAAMNIEYDFGLKAEDVVSYKGVKSNDNGDAGLVLVIEPAAGRAEAIVEALETYREDQVAFYGNYAEFAQAQANVSQAILSANDSRVVMAIPSNEYTSGLEAAVESALNG